eukprot:1140490-Pelagomonas_calceolata.AAC.2
MLAVNNMFSNFDPSPTSAKMHQPLGNASPKIPAAHPHQGLSSFLISRGLHYSRGGHPEFGSQYRATVGGCSPQISAAPSSRTFAQVLSFGFLGSSQGNTCHKRVERALLHFCGIVSAWLHLMITNVQQIDLTWLPYILDTIRSGTALDPQRHSAKCCTSSARRPCRRSARQPQICPVPKACLLVCLQAKLEKRKAALAAANAAAAAAAAEKGAAGGDSARPADGGSLGGRSQQHSSQQQQQEPILAPVASVMSMDSDDVPASKRSARSNAGRGSAAAADLPSSSGSDSRTRSSSNTSSRNSNSSSEGDTADVSNSEPEQQQGQQ